MRVVISCWSLKISLSEFAERRKFYTEYVAFNRLLGVDEVEGRGLRLLARSSSNGVLVERLVAVSHGPGRDERDGEGRLG